MKANQFQKRCLIKLRNIVMKTIYIQINKRSLRQAKSARLQSI